MENTNIKPKHKGLTIPEVEESRKKHGINVLTPPEKEPLWKLFLEKFKDPIIRILLIAAFLSLGISFITKEFAETFGIFFAILLATGVSFWFEMDANKKFDILNQVNDDTKVKVIREDRIFEILKRDVVVGDIVMLETGEEVPADGDLLEAVSLQIDESCLTGEPIIDKTVHPEEFDKEATYPSNAAMRGTKVMDGHGILEIKKVGDATEYGKVAQKSTQITNEVTPLNLQLEGLAKFIGVIGFSLAILTFMSLFVKDLFFSVNDYTSHELTTLGIVLVSAVIALVKIWLPIVYDAIEIFSKKEKLMPEKFKKSGWLKWFGFGILTFIALSGIAYIFGLNIIKDDAWVSIESAGRILQYFMIAVTLIVVAVPEGLPMSVTLSLALSMRRMLQTNNLVRKMHACETMGAATVICTDKTGTLTQNQMQVYETQFYGLTDNKLAENELSSIIKEGISVNSTAFLDFSEKEKIQTLGNPTEAALLLWLHKQNINYFNLREESVILEQLTFSTARKFMATLVDSPLIKKKVLYVKGAPEIVMSLCKNVLVGDKLVPVEEYKTKVEKQLLDYQNQAMRTLGFAYEIVEDENDRFKQGQIKNANLVFLGIAAISDPVREDVPMAVQKCISAGVEVKIVTGDTSGTAKEIGRQIGIWNENDTSENIMTGIDFENLSEEEALEKVGKLKILCRARPTDKQRLVKLLQDKGSVVAVTGDGTNDAPALNFAHVGLSMGSGTSVAKEASDITLLDDSFNSIATAVMWGRSLYQNIQKFIIFQLTINVAALFIVFLGSVFGHELPLTVTQMLWVNLIMDTFAAGALASLPPDPKVMLEKPRKSTDFIITPPMRFNILFTGITFVAILIGLLFFFADSEGNTSPYNLSMFFTIFVMFQFWNMFNAKAFATKSSAFKDLKNSKSFLFVSLLILVGQILIVSFGGEVFRTVPLSIKDWLIIIFSTSSVLIIGELLRFIKKKQTKI